MNGFNITYERINEEEASAGDTDRRGFIEQDVSLRDAFTAMRQNAPAESHTVCVQPDASTAGEARSISASHFCWKDGDSLTLTLHFPHNVTQASRMRLVNLFTQSRRYSL